MKIKNIKFTFSTKKYTDTQSLMRVLEDSTKEFFKTPFKTFNVPANAPDEIFRFLGEPKMGFVILANGNNVFIEYKNIPDEMDDSFVLEQLSNIVRSVGPVLENFIDCPFNYVGITTVAKFSEEEIGTDALNYMIKKMHGYDVDDVIDHLEYKATYIEQPYFIN